MSPQLSATLIASFMTVSPLRSIVRAVQACVLWLACGLALAADDAVLRLGVLAFQGKSHTVAQWTETARFLSTELAPRRVELQALTYDEINAGIAEKKLDLVLSNPEHFVTLQKAFGLRPLATLATRIEGRPYETFGGVIFTRTNTKLQRLEDVRGQKVAAVGLYSLGGFLAQARELNRIKIDLRSRDVASLQFTGVPHDLVVQSVLKEDADVGMVRAGVLEAMAARGELDLRSIRVIHANTRDAFPYRLSTDLYPEWPLAVLPHVSGLLAKDIMLAAQRIEPTDPAALKGRYHGFLPVADYSSVSALMNELRIFPNVDKRRVWVDFWHEYEDAIVTGLVVLGLALLLLVLYLVVHIRRQRRLTDLYKRSQDDLLVTATAFNSPVGLLVTDQHTRIIKANPALCELLGYPEPMLLGQTTRLFRTAQTPDETMRALWFQLQATGLWRGEVNCRHHDGRALPCMVSVKALSQVDQFSGYVASFTDLSVQKQTELAIRQLAYFDSLTGLPNRRMCLEQLEQAVSASSARNDAGSLGALIFIDLDHFKLLNDTHGHEFGDQLLTLIAQRLTDALPDEAATVARMGGDEFVVMLTDLDGHETQALATAMAMAEKLHLAMLKPCSLRVTDDPGAVKHLTYHCTGSVGVTLFGTHAETMTEVLKRADLAMYQAKHAGRNAVRAFEVSVQLAMQRKGILSADLSGALSRGELSLHYQLQTDANGKSAGAEVLLRWFHPIHGQVGPVEFIPLAEESGAIVDIGEWILTTACKTLADWARRPAFSGLSLSVNISPRQFIEKDFVARLQNTLIKTGAPASMLMLEVTEGIVMQNTDQVIHKMQELCDLGVSFSVDDFGTGYSSLSYLQRLPLRQVKIDKAFVHDVTYNDSSASIVRAILALAHSMNLTVVSEGVETPEQRQLLADMGWDEFQGYLLGRPAMLATFEAAVLARAQTEPVSSPSAA